MVDGEYSFFSGVESLETGSEKKVKEERKRSGKRLGKTYKDEARNLEEALERLAAQWQCGMHDAHSSRA